MAIEMNTEQRKTSLEAYNPSEHLISINKSGKNILYYPAAWRLFELSLRYSNANFSSEIIHMDVERNMVIVKCKLYIGASYEASEKKAEAFKQGKLSELDKVETAAKARCARDFGIGTEYALDMSPDETDATHEQRAKPATRPQQPARQPETSKQPQQLSAPTENAPSVRSLIDRTEALFGPDKWHGVLQRTLGSVVPDEELTPEQCIRVHRSLAIVEERRKST
jgi:hypothetical protein